MSKPFDLAGKTFGRWKVIEKVESYRSPKGYVESRWLCECCCNKHTRRVVNGKNLVYGKSTSCGCRQKELTVQRSSKDKNVYEFLEEFVKGFDDKGNFFLIDKEDYEKISQKRWHLADNGYWVNGERTRDLLHRYIMRPPKNQVVDHINRNPSDNRKNNLRICYQYQNTINQKIRSNNTFGICGVSYDKRSGKWEAHIKINKKKKSLGLYSTLQEAAKARYEAEDEYYGEFVNKEKRGKTDAL